ncbi:unnamed protein product [Nyctereutes procyonoides]|uniref:(raccoon dog) hypothetical protein n=1 Tax=Nyctereutes procyonoides TaxID=34880 RepID=A0A811Z539_NYCPR|nr:unnamed protein product [Nyctereutes procyonoides]
MIGPHRTHTVRIWGVNKKYYALELDMGNFWGSECFIVSNNELVCTKTLVKNCIKIQKKYDERKKNTKISSLLEEELVQCGQTDGYVLLGKMLEF